MSLLATGQALSAESLAQEVPELEINSERYIVADVETGYVFAQRDAHEQVPIASLTKVFTAVQAMAMAPLDTPIRTEDSDLRAPEGDYFGSSGTVMGFGAGETYTLEDMLYGMLLPSGNDAANAIARTLGAQPGDTAQQATQRFMDGLNQRLVDMGLTDTHLVNPHGWGVLGHHSSAWDIAAFARYVSADPTLMKMLGTREYTTSNGLLTVRNTNRLLAQEESVIGGKTGFDLDAGYCLMNIAGQGDARMVAVTLDGIAPGDWYDDNRVLLEYGFQQKQSLPGGGESFSGDVAAFVDPASIQIARNVAAGASAPDGTVDQAAVQPPTSDAPSPVERSASEQALWVAIVAAAGVITARGAISLRGPRRRTAVDMRRADT